MTKRPAHPKPKIQGELARIGAALEAMPSKRSEAVSKALLELLPTAIEQAKLEKVALLRLIARHFRTPAVQMQIQADPPPTIIFDIPRPNRGHEGCPPGPHVHTPQGPKPWKLDEALAKPKPRRSKTNHHSKL